MNVVVTGSGKFVEVQGTAEGAPFDRDELEQAAGPGAARHRAARRHPARHPGRGPVSGDPGHERMAAPRRSWSSPPTTRASCGNCASCCAVRCPGSTSTRRWWTRRRRCSRRRRDRRDLCRELAAEGAGRGGGHRARGDRRRLRAGRGRPGRRARHLLRPLGRPARRRRREPPAAAGPARRRAGRAPRCRLRLRRGARRRRGLPEDRRGGGVRPAGRHAACGSRAGRAASATTRSCSPPAWTAAAPNSARGEERHQPPRQGVPGAAAGHRRGTGPQ